MMTTTEPSSEPEKTPVVSKVKTKKNISEVLKNIENYKEELDNMEDYCTDRCHVILKAISSYYWSYHKHRKDIADKLSELNYPDQLVKMLKAYNHAGVFRDDNVWFPTYYSLNIIWNFTDASPNLCKEMVVNGIVDIIGANISHMPYVENQSSQNVAYLLKSSLSILHNISQSARDLPEFQAAFEKAQVKETLHKYYLTSENPFFKCVATMIITAIITEEENKMLEDTGAIPFIVTTLKAAINNSKRRNRGFAPLELVHCLSRMAMNDKNKATIVEEGALTELVKMLEYSDVEENAVAARTIWILSFGKDTREKIKAEQGMMEALNKLKDSEHKETRTCAEGALWTINETNYKKLDKKDVTSKNHVFISYDWSNQPMIKKINRHLKEAGYRTWVDFEQMSGSTLEAMSQAVENSAVVLICASEKYKQSPNCRTEAEYTFQLKKDIVPLMMQRHYKPDGWLGMLLGSKFYINFDGKYEFEAAMEMLLRELNGRGKDDSSTSPDAPAQIAPIDSSFTFSTSKSGCRSWTEKQVEEFLDNAGLTRIKNQFSGFNGEMLADLKSIKVEAPDFFYRHLEQKMNMDLLEIVKLTAALKKL